MSTRTRRALAVAGIVGLLSACGGGGSGGSDGPLDADDWRDDIDFLAARYENMHPNLYHTVSAQEFIAAVAQLKADALQAADYAIETGKPVIVQGFSLGTGLATYVAARREVSGTILTAPYDSLCRLMAVRSYLPACWLPVQRWQSLDDARAASAPILVLHGAADGLIPPAFSERFKVIQGLRRLIIPGAAHNDIGAFPAFGAEIEAFIDALLGT